MTHHLYRVIAFLLQKQIIIESQRYVLAVLRVLEKVIDLLLVNCIIIIFKYFIFLGKFILCFLLPINFNLSEITLVIRIIFLKLNFSNFNLDFEFLSNIDFIQYIRT